MTYLLDTNILLAYLRDGGLANKIDKHFQPLAYPNTPIVSVVSLGELKSIALRNNWGQKRLDLLDKFVKQFLIADINIATIIDKYAEIDAFSQGKLASKLLKESARNMGKNDLWIAASASVLKATLLTSDHDFSHLKNEYINLEIVDL
jgi:predicted nucleic acid-binding protein